MIGDHFRAVGLRDGLRDIRAGIGFYHLADETSLLPDGFPTASLCGAPQEAGAQLVWRWTPLCRKCRRIGDTGVTDDTRR